jgi:DNA recombination-dependent growth factor C
METVGDALNKNVIKEIDDQSSDRTIGWTSFAKPFQPDFSGSSFVYGPFFVFSLRIDKKNIPSKVVQKQYTMEADRRMIKSGRQFLSKSEKKQIKDHVINVLSLRIPATPNVYDLIWNMEAGRLWFFSNLKTANEELETLFTQSFKLSLIRIFPYTAADLFCELSDSQRDALRQLTPTRFIE